jgi:YebC/PmpR family DNA-binding regulatory protein
MAGHNKWSKVKHIKERVDAKKGAVFGKLSRELTVAAKSGGDPDMNPRLRSAILAAKSVNMPTDNIERAIKKGTGELAGDVIEEAVYEGFAPGGVAVMVEVATDNKNRTLGEIRTTLNKAGGSLGSSGSVAFLFDRKGEIKVLASAISEDALMEMAIEAGADDVSSDGEEHLVLTAPDQLNAVAHFLKERGLTPASCKLVFVPQTTISLTDSQVAAQVLKVCEALDDLDDTQAVYANFDIPEAVMPKI